MTDKVTCISDAGIKKKNDWKRKEFREGIKLIDEAIGVFMHLEYKDPLFYGASVMHQSCYALIQAAEVLINEIGEDNE